MAQENWVAFPFRDMTLAALSVPPDDSLPDDPSDRVYSQMEKRLRRVRGPGEMFAALRWGLGELERTHDTAPVSIRRAVACRSGCDACCHLPVDVQAHEVFFVAEQIQQQFAPGALEELVARLAAHRARVAAFAPGARDTSRQPCALLVAGACSIYDARPQPCRAHHTSDAAVCRAHREDPAVDIERVYVPRLRARLFAVMLSVDAALEAAGYDERAYDFGSALHEALTNSLCLPAWLRGEPAFPDDCLAHPGE